MLGIDPTVLIGATKGFGAFVVTSFHVVRASKVKEKPKSPLWYC